MPEVIILLLGTALLVWWAVDLIQRRRRVRPRPFWEAPPFPLENADRVYNWEQRVAIMSKGLLYPPHLSDRAVQDMLNKPRVKHGFF